LAVQPELFFIGCHAKTPIAPPHSNRHVRL
jgi:hypothetical protein